MYLTRYTQKSKLILGMALMLFPMIGFAQVDLARQVVASAGMSTDLSSGYSISATVGETVVYSSDNPPYDFGQGFQQADDAVLLLPLSFNSDKIRAQCPEIHDGVLEIFPSGCRSPYTVTLNRLYDSLLIDEKTNVLAASSAKFTGLDSGGYIITVRGANLCTSINTTFLELEYNTCDIGIYSGITPNGDGKNDKWIIANIESNQPNDVRIYSRWGTMVWNTENYNNEDNAWTGQSNGSSHLPDGTYFYVIKIPDNPDASSSGWIQLTR